MLARQEELRADINRYHDPITRRLPPEIVSTIFESYAQDYAEEKIDDEGETGWEISKNDRSPLVLGAVCRSWRQISWSSPQLWTHIGIRLTRPDDWNCLEITQKWLDRSHQLPLSIHLSIHQPEPLLAVDPREVFSRLISLINQQSSRWQNLRVFCSPVLLPLIRGDGHGAPILHSLSVAHPQFLEQIDSIEFSFASVKCRPTYFLSLNLSFQSFHIDWSQVTKAQFTESIDIYLNEFIELLQQAPQLVDCQVPVIIDSEPTYQLPQLPVVHRNLQSLTLGTYRGTKLRLVFNILLFPQLAHLCLVAILDSHLGCFVDLITRSGCRITSLELRRIVCHYESLLRLLRNTSSLRELELRDCADLYSAEIDLHRLLSVIYTNSFALDYPQELFLPNLRFLHHSDFNLMWDASFWAHIPEILVGTQGAIHNSRKRPFNKIELSSQTYGPGFIRNPPPLCMDENIVLRLVGLSKSGVKVDLKCNSVDLLKVSMLYHHIMY
ncbi:hypothetical protein CVT25_001607 [Psilocybe cyanescens]|uniref:Uncharacterized protein n=1 Tax=Psilocybe cyanescens TaxID=93625 RepID=A0A409WPX5_PSICY|nr:hypothetical protein CVT25_001607 [Psilocybe cyanescens]